jgi:hypothetical protein
MCSPILADFPRLNDEDRLCTDEERVGQLLTFRLVQNCLFLMLPCQDKRLSRRLDVTGLCRPGWLEKSNRNQTS